MANALDQYRTPWRVEAGDPAAGHMNLLKRLGYKRVFLPREVLTGARQPVIMDEQVRPGLPWAIPPGPVGSPPTRVPDALALEVRMRDCLLEVSN